MTESCLGNAIRRDLKMAGASLAPFGTEVVPVEQARSGIVSGMPSLG